MILQSLVRYYDILAEDPNSGIPLLGYSRVNVSYALNITKEGELLSIIPLRIPDKKGTKYIPISMIVPEQKKRTVGIKSNFLCDNSTYVFGLDNKGKIDRAKNCFQAFKELHLRILNEAHCDEATAVVNFVKKWDVEKAYEHPVLSKHIEDIIQGANLVFQLDSKPGVFIHDYSEVKHAWEKYKGETSSENVRQCLVTGKRSRIAVLHPSIKGIIGGQAMGNSLVSFNALAYESYGNYKSQGLNAPVSENATFAYTTVLNYLLSDNAHKFVLGDTTVMFWAESPNRGYQDCVSLLLDPSEITSDEVKERKYDRDENAVREIKNLFEKISSGKAVKITNNIFDERTRFFILGLSPNAARISIRFFIQNSFGEIVEKFIKHYQYMQIEKQYNNEPNSIPIWRILYETVSPKSNEKTSSPLLSGTTLRSILQGLPYPMALYNAILTRVKAEQSINYFKAAVIKANLLRNFPEKNYKEVLTMGLNDQSDNKAYVLGRLFAVLEKAQVDANPKINTTIKDMYFTSACATPARVFPIILRLSNHHISKAEYGFLNDKRITEIMEKLDIKNNPYPRNLSLEEQGLFILGYYHQKNKLYKKVEKEN